MPPESFGGSASPGKVTDGKCVNKKIWMMVLLKRAACEKGRDLLSWQKACAMGSLVDVSQA